MTPELTVLALAALLQLLQLMLYAVPANLELGVAKTLSPRDAHRLGKPLAEQLSVRTARLWRAYNNHQEALVLFAIAVAVVTLSAQSTGFTALCAWVYLGARLLYVPAYAFGWVPWRSVIYGVGLLATLSMILATLI